MIDPATERVLVFAPRGRDAELACAVLAKHDIEAVRCGNARALVAKLGEGAGCTLVTTDVLDHDLQRELGALLAEQPPWSDAPFVVLASGTGAARDSAFDLGNVTVLERPIAPQTLLTAVRAALRGRRRQYDARRAIMQRDQFLAMLGHELRNPLSAIVLASHPLPMSTAVLAQTEKRLAIIARQAQHLTHLVNDLLDVARVSTGKVQLRREAVDIGATIRNCLESLEARAHERSLAFVAAPASDVIIEGDAGRIEQVIGNLVTNAIKYSPVGRTIAVSSAVHGDWCEIRVRDQGIGIAPDMIEHVFDLFAQADGSLDRSEGGMGIGLALVDRLVRLHGGTVSVTSAGIGLGSEFVVRLPIGHPPVKLASVPHAGDDAGPPLRVVVVDDNADLLELTSVMLREIGCVVETAVDGEEGLARIVAMRPDLALVDIGLPKLDGFEVAKLVRERGQPIVLVAVSGYGQRHDKERSAAAGFDQHLTKPVTPPTLIGLVSEVRAELARRKFADKRPG
jgi:signal transduction histidine kinase/ActR/RegA family two-component response regulator